MNLNLKISSWRIHLLMILLQTNLYNMVSIENVTVEFNGTPLFEEISFQINDKERIGLAGKNGAGKTTLLKILNKEIMPTSGTVVVPQDVSLGYLPQEKMIKSKLNVLEETLSAFSNINQLKQEYETISQQLSIRTDYDNPSYLLLIEKMNDIQHTLLVNEEDKLEGNAIKVLNGLGFKSDELDKKVSDFSLGWQMRIELAKLLLLKPGLLLLDEPTNHLDIEAIQWLENFLKNYTGSILLVSHDRAFLDNLTLRTLEINNHKIFDYKVPYSKYLMLSKERISQQKAAFENQQKKVKETEAFIERFRYKASKAKQVQSRVKMLEKMDMVSVDELDNSKIHFRFPPAPRSGKVVVEGNVSKQYGELKVLNDVNFHILKGEKIGFIGRNGEGKTTLLKIISGHLDYSGELKFGHNVISGYYAQDQWEMLDKNKTVFETMDDIAVGDIRKQLNSILGAFLFRGDDVDKKISVLSGGEKARLSLARLLLKPTNLLILDEPTNHLDLISKDILKSALLDYDGTLIVVSHDRDFLHGLTDRFYEFKNHKINEFRGSLEQFLKKRNLEQLDELEKKKKPVPATTKQTNKNIWAEKKEKEKYIRKIKREMEKIEKQLDSSEKLLNEINEKLSDPENFSDEIKNGNLFKKHEEIQKEIETLYEEWSRLDEKL